MSKTYSRNVQVNKLRNPYAEDAWEHPGAGPHGHTRTSERQAQKQEVESEVEEALLEMGMNPDEVLK